MTTEEFDSAEVVYTPPTAEEFDQLQAVYTPPTTAQQMARSAPQAMMQLSPLQALGYQAAPELTPRFEKTGNLGELAWDVETLPGRFLASSISAMRGEGFPLGKTSSDFTGETGRWQDLLRARGMTAGALAGGLVAPSAIALGATSPMHGGLVGYGVPSAVGALGTQAERVMEQNLPVSPLGFVGETAGGIFGGAALKLAGKKVLPMVQDMLEKGAEKFSGIADEALKLKGVSELVDWGKRQISTKWADAPPPAGSPRAVIQQATELKQNIRPFAMEFVQLADDIGNTVRADMVNRNPILANSPNIDISDMIAHLKSLKITSPSGNLPSNAVAFNNEIDDIINVLSKKESAGSALMNEPAKTKTLYSALDILKFRDLLKNPASFQMAKDQRSMYDKLYADIYGRFKDKLLESAKASGKGSEYEQMMKKASEMLDKRDRIYQYIGTNLMNQEERAERFIRTLSTDKKVRTDFINDIDVAFGKDFSKKSKLLALGKNFDEMGKLPWWTKVQTGLSGTPMAVADALGMEPIRKAAPVLISPKVAAPALAISRVGQKATSAGLERGAIPLSMIGMEAFQSPFQDRGR